MQDQIDRFKKNSAEVKKQIREKTLSYMTAGLGLVAGLAWNEAIKGLIEMLFPLERNNVLVKFIYAILITVVIVILTTTLVRVLSRDDENKNGKT